MKGTQIYIQKPSLTWPLLNAVFKQDGQMQSQSFKFQHQDNSMPLNLYFFLLLVCFQ